MKHTLFLVEGQTEQIFLLHFIQNICAAGSYAVLLDKLSGGQVLRISRRGHPEEEATHIVQIINMQGDDTVNTFIRDNLAAFKRRGIVSVYGLRDRYTGSKTKTKVDPTRIDEWAAEVSKEYDLDVEITIALEEVEAWFLSVPKFFLNYDTKLDIASINKLLGFNLEDCDVELLEHPASLIDKILRSVNLAYKKRADDSHKIATGLDYDEIYLVKSQEIAPLGRLVAQLGKSLPD